MTQKICIDPTSHKPILIGNKPVNACPTDPCNTPVGVCCKPDHTCALMTASACAVAGGVAAPSLGSCSGVNCSSCSCCGSTLPPPVLAVTFPADSAGGARTVVFTKNSSCGYTSSEAGTALDLCASAFPSPATQIQVFTSHAFELWNGDYSSGGGRACTSAHFDGIHLVSANFTDAILSVPT